MVNTDMNKKVKNTLKNCLRCNHDKFNTGPGKGPHIASLRCANCNRFMWLQKTEYFYLANH